MGHLVLDGARTVDDVLKKTTISINTSLTGCATRGELIEIRYFVNVLTEILLIHECKDFLQRQRRRVGAVARFCHRAAPFRRQRRRGLSSPDFDLCGETLSCWPPTQPLFVQDSFADKNAEQRATERKWTGLNDGAVTVGTMRGAGAGAGRRERKTRLSAGRPRLTDHFQRAGRNADLWGARVQCRPAGVKSCRSGATEMSGNRKRTPKVLNLQTETSRTLKIKGRGRGS